MVTLVQVLLDSSSPPGWTGIAVVGRAYLVFNGHFLWGQNWEPSSLEEPREVMSVSVQQAPGLSGSCGNIQETARQP